VETESRRSYVRAAEWFGEELTGPVTVHWVAEERELERYGASRTGSIAGLAIPSRGRVVLSAPALSVSPERIPSVLLHEFCHLLFAAATDGAEVEPPRWLNEGIAMWISGEWDLGLAYRVDETRLLADAAAAGSLLPFRDLDAGFPAAPFLHVAYAQSRSLVAWLVKREGEEGLRRLLGELDADLEPDAAFEAVYGLPFPEAEDEWRRSVERGGPLHFLPSARVLFSFGSVAIGVLMILKFIRVRRQLRRIEHDGEPEDRGPRPTG
jgi:hypothetical protein